MSRCRWAVRSRSTPPFYISCADIFRQMSATAVFFTNHRGWFVPGQEGLLFANTCSSLSFFSSTWLKCRRINSCRSDWASYATELVVLWSPCRGRGSWLCYFSLVCGMCSHYEKSKRKVQRVPQSQTAALPRPQEEEETDKSKQAQTEQTYEKH